MRIMAATEDLQQMAWIWYSSVTNIRVLRVSESFTAV
jgi:virulence-associated protein VapD